MWWFRDQQKNTSTASVAPQPAQDASSDPSALLDATLAEVLRDVPLRPHGLLAMSLLVDHAVQFTDGTELPPMTWQKAEEAIARARGPDNPTRLYNAFAQELGDGYSQRHGLPPEHSAILAQLRGALLASGAIRSLAGAS